MRRQTTATQPRAGLTKSHSPPTHPPNQPYSDLSGRTQKRNTAITKYNTPNFMYPGSSAEGRQTLGLSLFLFPSHRTPSLLMGPRHFVRTLDVGNGGGWPKMMMLSCGNRERGGWRGRQLGLGWLLSTHTAINMFHHYISSNYICKLVLIKSL